MYSRSHKHSIRLFIPMLVILTISLSVLGGMLFQSRVFKATEAQDSPATPDVLHIPALKSSQRGMEPVETRTDGRAPKTEPIAITLLHEGAKGSKATEGTPTITTTGKHWSPARHPPENPSYLSASLADTAEARPTPPLLTIQPEPVPTAIDTAEIQQAPHPETPAPEPTPIKPTVVEPSILEIVPEADVPKIIQVQTPVLASESESKPEQKPESKPEQKPELEPAKPQQEAIPTTAEKPESKPIPAQEKPQQETTPTTIAEPPTPSTASLMAAFTNTPNRTTTLLDNPRNIPSTLPYRIETGQSSGQPLPSEARAGSTEANPAPNTPRTGWIYGGQFRNGSWVSAGLILSGHALPQAGKNYPLAWGANVRAAPPGQRSTGNNNNLAKSIGYIAENKPVKVLSIQPSGQQGHIWLEITY